MCVLPSVLSSSERRALDEYDEKFSVARKREREAVCCWGQCMRVCKCVSSVLLVCVCARACVGACVGVRVCTCVCCRRRSNSERRTLDEYDEKFSFARKREREAVWLLLRAVHACLFVCLCVHVCGACVCVCV